MDFSGVLRNSEIRLDNDPELISTSIVDLSINHETFSLQGLSGQLSMNDQVGKMIIYSPSIIVRSSKYLDRELNLNDFKSLLSFKLVGESLEILPSEFSALVDDNQFED